MEETKTVEFSNVTVTVTVKPKAAGGVEAVGDTSLPSKMGVV